MRRVLTSVIIGALGFLTVGVGTAMAADRASEPPNPPGSFNGAPTAWIEAGGQSTWMDEGSSCWSKPADGGQTVTGCADTIGFSCSKRGNVPASRFFTVRPGDQVWVHYVGADVSLEGVDYDPFDIAADHADVEPQADGANVWTFRAPDAGALLTTFVRGAGATGGDAAHGLCLRVAGEAPAGADPVVVTSTRSLIRSRATAELRFGIDVSARVVPGSLRCSHVLRPAVSKSMVWRCSAVQQAPGRSAGVLRSATIATWQRGLFEPTSVRVLVLDSNQAHLGSRRGLVAVSGYLMEERPGQFRLCAAGYVSLPPSCNKGGVRVSGLDASAFRLDSFGARRFSRSEVVVSGRLVKGVLTARA